MIVEWQIANSPETNMLDPGAFCALQAKVEAVHKKLVMMPNVLSNLVTTAFQQLSSETLVKIAKRWELVLDLIVKGKGSNDLVEKCRGLKAKLTDDCLEVPDSDDEDSEKVKRETVRKKEKEVDLVMKEVMSVED